MKVNMNEKRVAILKLLENASEPMTLAEIASALGEEKIATGITNPMLTVGYMEKAGTKTVEVVIKKEVTTYKIGSVKPETTTTEKK